MTKLEYMWESSEGTEGRSEGSPTGLTVGEGEEVGLVDLISFI
jgi:hypothetical protein